MKVLVTGRKGGVGQAAIREILAEGHTVRLLSPDAVEEASQWPSGVEPWPASISDQAALRGCAEGCGLVLHTAESAEESGLMTYEIVNVDGTRAVVREAERCKVGRFIYLSSLGAEGGESRYHRSKRRAEDLVRNFAGGWNILRPGIVYGPGDGLISLLLTMVRTLPVLPVVGTGEEKFQPIWVEDLAAVIADCVRRTDLHGRVLEFAGADTTSLNDLLKRMGEITGRSPARIPVPPFLATAGATLAGIFGAKLPLNESRLAMLGEKNLISVPGANAIGGVFHIKPTPLDSGLRKLADAMPEQTPDGGIGELKRTRFWVDIAGSPLASEGLFAHFCARFAELTPLVDLHAEPGTPDVLTKGSTLTMALPVRGNAQLRVEQITPTSATLVTLLGHPLAGAIRFLSERRGDLLRFEVQIYDRPANLADWLAMRTVGEGVEASAWESLVLAMADESAGTSILPVQHEESYLDEDQSARIEAWVKELVAERKRSERRASMATPEAVARSESVESAATL
jgi:nucleoside-diphosphate-sugar epimerase